MPETTELVTVLTPETDYYPAWYILQVIRQDGVELWSAGAHPSHAGWTSVFACKIDGEDYLLQYEPEMYQAGRNTPMNCGPLMGTGRHTHRTTGR